MDILNSLSTAIAWPDVIAILSDGAGEMTVAVLANLVSRNLGNPQRPRLRFLAEIAAESLT